jgi:hypothetical protein
MTEQAMVEKRECHDCGVSLTLAEVWRMPLDAPSRERRDYCQRCAENHGLPDLSKCGNCKTALSTRTGRFFVGDGCYCWSCAEKVALRRKFH